MKKTAIAASLIAATLVASGPVLADKPAWAGNGKSGHKDEPAGTSANQGGQYFGAEARRILSDYYGQQARAGKCPPGLAKKRNGCLPPGQAKKWARGQPLPPGLIYNDLPGELLRRLPLPPPQHRYVQIAGDVLMIAIGTGMVVDAVEDLLR